MKKVLLILLLISPAFGQRYDNFASTLASASGIGNLMQAIPNATITVCNFPGTGGTPCTNKATTYTSQTLVTSCAPATQVVLQGSSTCQATSDNLGNFGFWASPGKYQYCISATNFTTQCYNILVTPDATILNSVLYVGGTISTWAGSDIGAQMNTAYAALPSTGGRIHVVSQNSCYSMSTAFTATTAGKPVLIEGDPGLPTCLNWTPTTGVAFTFDTRLNSNQHPVGMGMRDLVLTTSGAASSTAVVLGATNSGEGYTLMHVKIENFITGVSMTTSSGLTGTFAVAFLNDVFRNMTSCIVATGTGSAEMTKFIGGSFFNCGTAISSSATLSADFTVIGTSCDDPGAGGCIGNSVIVNWYGGHFENPGGGLPTYVNSNGIVNLYGGVALDDCIGLNNPVTGCTTTNSTSWFSLTGSDSMTILGTELFSGGRSMTTNPVVSVGGTGHGQLALYNKTPSLLTPLYAVNALVFSQITDLSWTNGGIQTNAFQSWKVPETGSTLPVGQGQFDLCYGDPTLHGLECNSNNAGFLPVGERAILTADWTCGTGGTVASCTSATIIGSGGGVPWTFSLPLTANSLQLDCDGVVSQATAVTLNQWNLLTATNGATNVTATYDMYTAATAKAGGAVTDQASTTTTFQISPSWTLGAITTKMPFHIHAAIEAASASGTVLSVQLLAPTVGDLVTIFRGSGCWVHP